MVRVIVRNYVRFSLRLHRMASSKICEKPIVVVLGATGVGKSKLALELGQVLNGEIVSVDSMQVYKGLDIITNKVTEEEQALCRHHLIGFLSPLEEYTIVDFQKHARNAIKDIHSRNKLPIICGGTLYYILALLWDFLTPTTEREDDGSLLRSDSDVNRLRQELEAMNPLELYQFLEEVDPEKASRLHPNDTRKVIRSVEIFRQTGEKHSDILKLQTEVLQERVDKRVDKMMEAGLLKELKDFHEEYNKQRLKDGMPFDYEHGIFQSIGFKEFHRFLTEDISGAEKDICLADSISRMKLNTWQYAKYQIKRLKKKIVNRDDALPVFPVDSTDPSVWDTAVYYPSLKIIQKILIWNDWVEGITSTSKIFQTDDVKYALNLEPITRTLQNYDDSARTKRSCEDCGRKVFLTDNEWEAHIKSRRHKRVAAARKRKLHGTFRILSKHEDRLRSRSEHGEQSSDADIDGIFKEISNGEDTE